MWYDAHRFYALSTACGMIILHVVRSASTSDAACCMLCAAWCLLQAVPATRRAWHFACCLLHVAYCGRCFSLVWDGTRAPEHFVQSCYLQRNEYGVKPGTIPCRLRTRW
jgi:hypothetical protein